MDPLNFDEMAFQNAARCERWHGPRWLDDDDSWTLADWSNAMGGEAGEAQNVVKKIRRIQSGLWATQKYPGDSTPGLAGMNSTEAMATLRDKLANEARIDLGTAVREKFNRVSEAQGFPERL